MRKFSFVIMVSILLLGVCTLGFGYKKTAEPNHYYKVYLDNEEIGTIKSKKILENYIDKNENYYKKKYNVDKVFYK